MDLHMDVVCEEVIDDGQGAVNTGLAAVDIDSELVAGDATGEQTAIMDDGLVDNEDASSSVISEAESTVLKSRKRVRRERKWKKCS